MRAAEWKHIWVGVLVLSCGCFRQEAPERVPVYTSLSSAVDHKSDARRVLLYRSGFTEVPVELRGLSQLEELSLRGNPLKGLPDWLGDLKALRSLDLGETGPRVAAFGLGQAAGVTHLWLNYNQVSNLPPDIARLGGLEYLNLDGNMLRVLPQEVCALSRLRWLRLNKNQLEVLPSEIGKLTNLERLYVSDNHLRVLPQELKMLHRLTDLELGGNQIENLPAWIGELRSLVRLDLDRNKLTAIPDEIGRLTDLRYLRIDRNAVSEEQKLRLKVLLPQCQILP